MISIPACYMDKRGPEKAFQVMATTDGRMAAVPSLETLASLCTPHFSQRG